MRFVVFINLISHKQSIYGRETYYEPNQRSYSPAPSQFQMPMAMGDMPPHMYPPPGYNSGRNTPTGGFAGAGGFNSSPLRSMSEVGYSGGGGLQQPAPSRPVTNYFDMPTPGSEGDLLGGAGANLLGPTDSELEAAVDGMLANADFNTVTKKNVRQQLEQQYDMDLSGRKAHINAAIDRAILAQS
jgi:chitin synthase